MSLPIAGEFLDGDRAVAEARLYWSVNGGFEKGDVSVTLDGKTGAFVKKDVMPGF